jgi:TonB family protein
VFFAIRFIIRLSYLIILTKRFGITKISGINYVFTDEKYAPFSFFNLVFINKKISKFDAEKIVAHEQIHVKQYHTLDILFFELLVIFQWFNPIVWLYKQSIKEVHEFLADKGVLTKGYEKKSYQQLLLALCMSINVTDLTNNFNTSQIKRRFIMMTKMKSGLIAKVKFMVVVPIIVITMVFIACNDTESKKPENSKSTTDSVKEQTQAVQANVDEPIFNEVEEMPVFGKTNNDLSNYLASNIKYPKVAMEKGIQGKVFISFVVTKTGEVANVKVEKPVNELLDAEAVRVVSTMPKWTPGMDKRNPVNVKLTLPINFKLN